MTGGLAQATASNNNNTQAQTQEQEATTANNSSGLVDQTFMKSLLNILCITIEQTDTLNLTYLWLDRLERFVKHIIIVAELWRTKNAQYYSLV